MFKKIKYLIFLSSFAAASAGCGNSGTPSAGQAGGNEGQTPVGSEPVVLPIPSPVPVPPGPAAPQWLSASEATYDDKVEIRWQAASGARYNLFRKTTSAAAFQLLHTGAEPFFTDSSAKQGITYYYAVNLINEQGQASALSPFDTGWRAHSAGCAARLSEKNSENRIALLRNGFSEPAAIAMSDNRMFIASGDGRIVMLNEQRDTLGVWNAGGAVTAMARGNTDGRIYALSGIRILRLTAECGIEKVAQLPAGTEGLDITLDAADNIYVSDDSSWDVARIFRFTSDGTPLSEWSFPGNGSFAPSFKAMHWVLEENVLLAADRTAHKISKFRIENDQPVKIADKEIAVIGEPTDIVTRGSNILVFVTANGTMHLIRYHSGFSGGAVIYTVGENWRTRITESAIHPVTGTLYATDITGKAIYSCAAPLFICDLQSGASSPAAISTDGEKNLFLLHVLPVSSIVKLNSNGAQMASRILPDYENRAVSGLSIRADGQHVYITANNGQKSLIARLNADLQGAVVYSERATTEPAYFDVAASAGRLISDQIAGAIVGEAYVTQAQFEASMTDGTKLALPAFTVSDDYLFSPYSKIETCATDEGKSLFYQLAGLGTDLRHHVYVGRLNPLSDAWQPLAVPASAYSVLALRCSQLSGAVFTFDVGQKGDASVAQRDSSLNEIRRWSAVPGLISKTFAVAADGESAYAASSATLHSFRSSEISAAATH